MSPLVTVSFRLLLDLSFRLSRLWFSKSSPVVLGSVTLFPLHSRTPLSGLSESLTTEYYQRNSLSAGERTADFTLDSTLLCFGAALNEYSTVDLNSKWVKLRVLELKWVKLRGFDNKRLLERED
jgi:hypothetical protein